jgi:hypothetical protein
MESPAHDDARISPPTCRGFGTSHWLVVHCYGTSAQEECTWAQTPLSELRLALLSGSLSLMAWQMHWHRPMRHETPPARHLRATKISRPKTGGHTAQIPGPISRNGAPGSRQGLSTATWAPRLPCVFENSRPARAPEVLPTHRVKSVEWRTARGSTSRGRAGLFGGPS